MHKFPTKSLFVVQVIIAYLLGAVCLSVQKHQSECDYRPHTCADCQQRVMYKDRDEHTSKLCPKLTVECKACHHHIQLSNLENHKNLCATATNSCPDCGEPLTSASMVGQYTLALLEWSLIH